MEHVTHFTTLLDDTVNLPDGKLTLLSERVDAIYAALKAANLGTGVLSKKRQGSWAQRTIINPPRGIEFDADFMLELEENSQWSPSDYNTAVYNALANHRTYGDMQAPVRAKNRCIRVTYANDMHVDVVPYVNLSDLGENIINADTDKWETNDADGFTNWMQEKDAITKKHMRQVIRLLKYLRDHRGWFEDTVSIILTTAVGNTIDQSNLLDDPDCYTNVPRALGRIVADLADWVRNNESRPEVVAQPGAVFTHRWLESEYQQFSNDIQALDGQVGAALVQTDEDESLRLWQELFGTGFKAAESSIKPTKFPATGAGAARTGAAGAEATPRRSGKAG